MNPIRIFCIFCSHLLFAAEWTQAEYKDVAKAMVVKIPGWCSPKKAEAMMELIFDIKPDTCVELGVFQGASLFPTALALYCVKHGVVYAIDAWDTQEAVRYYPEGSPHRTWWTAQNLNTNYKAFLDMIKQYNLGNHCLVLRQPFATALDKIHSIDILHIDATHTNEGDFIDAVPYIQKVKKGGYIWFDGWSSSFDTYEYLKKTCQVRKVINSGACILLQKIIEE